MGRHSAPADEGDVDVADVVARVDSGVDEDVVAPESAVSVGRHVRVATIPAERPVERTGVIPTVQAEAAADVDATGAPRRDIPAMELEPILPGEAITPPLPGEVDALDQLLTPSAPTRRWGRRPKPTKPEPEAEPAPGDAVAKPEAAPAMPEAAPAMPEAAPATPAPETKLPAAVAPPAVAPPAVAPAVQGPDQRPDHRPDQTPDLGDRGSAEPPKVPTASGGSAEPRKSAEPATAAKPAAAAQPTAAAKPAVPKGTPADVALLRADPALRARCIAGLLAPFAIYAVVLLLVGGHGSQWLLWIWIPTVLAGIVVGAFLDRAHRKNVTATAGQSAAVSGPADVNR